MTGTSYRDLFAALAADFGPGEVKWRPQGGKQVPYITARTVANRLDDVLGPESWWDDYVHSPHSVLCKLTIRLPDGSTVTKQDAGGAAGMQDEGDDEKSAYSDSFKRAAVKFGVGRLLYGDGSPSYETPSSAQSPIEVKDPQPASTRDSRTAWQLVSDVAGSVNDRFREAMGDPNLANITDAATIAGRLLWLAWEGKKSTVEPRPTMKGGELAHHMEECYANHRPWVRGELKRFVEETYSEAVRKASKPTEATTS
jgi:hypothetical protein